MSLKRRLDRLEAQAPAGPYYWPLVLVEVPAGTSQDVEEAMIRAERQRMAAEAGRDLVPPPPGQGRGMLSAVVVIRPNGSPVESV